MIASHCTFIFIESLLFFTGLFTFGSVPFVPHTSTFCPPPPPPVRYAPPPVRYAPPPDPEHVPLHSKSLC